MHEHHQRLGILVLHDQGFDHMKWVPAQHLGAVLRATVLEVIVRMLTEIDLCAFQQLGGRCFTHPLFFCHGTSLLGLSALLRRVAHLVTDRVNRLEQFRR